MSTIIKAKSDNSENPHWKTWVVEYAEFEGRYFLHDTEYQLQMYIQKLLQERTVLPEEIEKLLELQRDVTDHDRLMEECD